MKAYTNIEQSKKLAKILPLESADMSFVEKGNAKRTWYDAKNRRITTAYEKKYYIPCWSLAALLEIIPEPILTYIDENNWNISIFKDDHFKDEVISNNPLDACVDMIIKLHE